MIYIISRRQKTVPPTNTVTRRLERLFGVRLRHPVAQTNLKDKTPFIAARRILYYYGDSDSDITAAVGASAVPIRFQARGYFSLQISFPADAHSG
jgi:acid phosphatase (class B)